MTITHTHTGSELLTSIATSARNAKDDLLRAQSAWADAEGDALEAFIDAGLTTIDLPGLEGGIDRVTAEGMDEVRRTVDVQAALALLNPAQLEAVVNPAIAIAAVDAAVRSGVIPEALAAQFITVKQVKPSVRVTFNTKVVSK